MNQDQQFDAVIAAVARHNRRVPVDPEWAKKVQAEAHKKDPKHIKALAKRKKRKRGGPK